MPEALTEASTESKILVTAEPEETIKSKAPAKEHTVPEAPIEVEVPAQSKIINTVELEEIWGPSSMALPQLNHSPSSPLPAPTSPSPSRRGIGGEGGEEETLLRPRTRRSPGTWQRPAPVAAPPTPTSTTAVDNTVPPATLS